MEKLNSIEVLRLSRFKQFLYKVLRFLIAIPMFFVTLAKKIWSGIKKLGISIAEAFKTIGVTFVKGNWKTKVSYIILGFRNLVSGQALRGVCFILFEALFIFYMITTGAYWLGKFDNLGDATSVEIYNPALDAFEKVPGDDSFKILLYGLLTVVFIIAFILTWYMNVKQCKVIEEIEATGKKVKSGKEDLHSLVDDQFHKTLLALPLLGIFLFTVMPTIFMILVAFTNYDYFNNGSANLFTWVGLQNFNEMFFVKTGSGAAMGLAFGEILSWTLMWAFFATFTNYFLGMLVAIMINKKGIKLKKMWRGILVLTSAVPQFISLLYVARMFDNNGLVNGLLINWGIIKDQADIIKFWENKDLARVMVILINIWIGIPYLMLISTGVLMNIPQDLYESAKIDGANPWQQYMKITLPYMLFVTGPYLLTSFMGNINNFNVIYLLSGGGPTNPGLVNSSGSVGYTDLLITWLFKITMGAEPKYNLASVLGILIFIVMATLSVIVYNVIPSTKNEEDFS